MLQLVFTDKPLDDKEFFLHQLPGVRRCQSELDAAALPAPDDGLAVADAIESDYGPPLNIPRAIGTQIDMMRDLVRGLPIERRVIALDTECDTVKNAQGQPIGKMRDSVIQLAYEHPGGKIRALVVQLKGRTLHPRLLALLGDPTITFCGSNVSADLKKLGKDFGCQRTTQRAQCVNLGMMARKRDVVPSGVVSLDRLVAVCLGQRLEKDPSVRLSLWSSPRLTPMQVKYAALDALKSLEVYFHLLPLPDLTVRLASGDALPGAAVEIVPPHGSVAVLATRGAVATIEPSAECSPSLRS